MTNGDKIRSMTNEQLARFITAIIDCCTMDGKLCVKCPLYEAGEFCLECEIAEYLGKEVIL